MDDEVFQGLHVLSLFPGSVAERAGVMRGDYVLIANGIRTASLADFVNARALYKDRLELTLRRGNDIIEKVLRFDRHDGPISDPKIASA